MNLAERFSNSPIEALTAYYAVKEIGDLLNNQAIKKMGQYLYMSELKAAYNYHYLVSNSYFTPAFYDYGIVDEVGETSVGLTNSPQLLFAIQMSLPIEITPTILNVEWLKRTRDIWGSNIESVSEILRGQLYLLDAIVDPNRQGLSEKIHQISQFNTANSKTNTLFFYYLIGGQPL